MTETASAPPAAPVFNRKNPFPAALTLNLKLNKPGSEKDTRHFILSLAGSGLSYTPGDSLGVFPRNSPELVDELITTLGLDPNAKVNDPKGQPTTFRETLLNNYTLNRANKKILTGLVERIEQGEQRNHLMALLASDEELNKFVFTRDFVDVLKEFSEAKFTSPEGFLSQINPIAPRLYSIASSLQKHPNEVHLCIAIVRYDTHGRKKKGLCSGYFADHAELNKNCIPVFIQESKSFRLPTDGARDIIMCGPGTGIAPFRAFLEQRVLDSATGRNWLLFGDQRRALDFLYEEEFLGYQRQGKLQRLDLAFSRDQAEKVYVQDRLRENGKELWAWLQGGAYFYVCGDAKRMAKDVHDALIGIAQSQGGLTPEAAAEYINTTLMKTEKRYLRDVY
jgi:sulfite reductase (NADPH) flavoprotein alpha-component